MLNEPGFESVRNPKDVDNYNEAIQHESIRVAVLEMLGETSMARLVPDELRSAIVAAFELGKPSCINVLIDPRAGKKPQEHAWLTQSEKPATAEVTAEGTRGISLKGPTKM